MVAFYNAADQELYKDYQFVPQEKYRTGFTAPKTEEEKVTETFGIPNTNAFTNSGGGGGGGNAFGYGTAIKPGDPSVLTSGPYAGQSGYYDSLSYSGGLPGNVSQKGPGRHFEYDNTGSFYKDYSLTPRREVPGLLRAGAAFVPFGNFALNKIENKMNPQGPFTKDDNPYGGTYGVAGLSDEQKSLYDNLAADGMLFDGPGGLKTLTGKNFTGKGYMEGQIENAYGFGFDTMTDQEIEDDLEASRKNKKKQFEYKQKIESLKALKQRQKEFEKPGGTKDQVAAIQARVDKQYEADKARDGRDFSVSGPDTSANPTGKSNQASSERGYAMHGADGGRAGYFFGGRVNYKAGGRINFRGGGADMGAEDRAQDRADKGYGNTDGVDRSAVGPGSTYQRNVNNQTSTVKNIIDVGSELNYLNNLKNLNLPGIAVGFGVNKFRDFIGKKNKEEDDKLSALPTNNYMAEVQQKDIDASKMRGFKQQDYSSYKDQMDMLGGGTKVTPYEFQGLQDGTITTTGTFTAANGGRAMFKNGGLASIL